jgi:hypothetical protein
MSGLGGTGGAGLSPLLLNTIGKTIAKMIPITTTAITMPQMSFFFFAAAAVVGELAPVSTSFGISLSCSNDSDLSCVFVFLSLFIEDFLVFNNIDIQINC